MSAKIHTEIWKLVNYY